MQISFFIRKFRLMCAQNRLGVDKTALLVNSKLRQWQMMFWYPSCRRIFSKIISTLLICHYFTKIAEFQVKIRKIKIEKISRPKSFEKCKFRMWCSRIFKVEYKNKCFADLGSFLISELLNRKKFKQNERVYFNPRWSSWCPNR